MSTKYLVKRIVGTLKHLSLPLDEHHVALDAIALAGSTILQGKFFKPDGTGCLAVVAVAAIKGESPSNFRKYFEFLGEESEETIAKESLYEVLCETLQLSEDAVHDLIHNWDSCNRAQCNAVVRRIRDYAETLAEKITERDLESLSHYEDAPTFTAIYDDQVRDMKQLLGSKARFGEVELHAQVT